MNSLFLKAALATLIVSGIFSEPSNAQTGAAQFPFRLGTSVNPKHPNGVFAETFKKEVEEKSGGRIQIQLITGGALGGEAELANQVRTGQLDLCSIAVPPAATISPALNLSEVPFFYKDYASARRVLDGEPGQIVLSRLEQAGIKGLAWGEIGFRGVMTTGKPVNSPADVAGLKIRVVENKFYLAMWRALGANPVPMAWPEVYTALQQRTIDGVDTNYAGLIDAKQYEVAKNLAVLNHSYTANLLFMNPQKFNGLPDDLKTVVLNAAKLGAAASRTAAETVDHDAVSIMEKNGVTVTKPDPAPFRSRLQELHAEFERQVGADIVAKARDINGKP